MTEENLRPSSFNTSTLSVPSTSGQQIISPEMIRPFAKAGPRQKTIRNSRKMLSAIITDSPEKNKIKEKESRQKKKNVKKITTKKSLNLHRKSEKNGKLQ